MPLDGIPSGYELASEEWRRAWTPRAPLLPSEWATKHRRLSAKASSEPGPWSNDRIPFLQGIMDSLSPSHPARHVLFIKSAQVGGSECGLNWLGWTIHESPAPMMAVFPSDKSGKRWVRGRLQPMIAETPVLRELVPLGRKADNGNTLDEKDFPDGKLYIGSAGTPNDLASVSVARLLREEIDRWPRELENEGDPLELSEQRGAMFARFKIFDVSTPTIESLSRINQFWKQSSQCRYYVPCPHCLTYQYLRWEQLTWPEGRPKEAVYLCESCAAGLLEHQKTDMLAAGEWRATFPERSADVEGFHANCLMTPIGLGDSWGLNAARYERVRPDASKLKVFINTRLGETHADPKEKLDWETLWERREPYQVRTIPHGYYILTAGVDVQHNRLEVQFVAWGPNERAVVVDYVVLYGDPTRDDDYHDVNGNPVRSVWHQLDDVLAGSILNEHGIAMRVSAAAVDAGYRQGDVLNFTRTRRARNIFATKGQPQLGRMLIKGFTLVDVNFRGREWKRGAALYPIGVSTAKATLYDRLRADAQVLPSDRHVRFSDDMPEEYFRQLTAEVFDPHKAKWIQVYERNEALDTFVLAMAAAMHESTQVHRMRADDWARMAELYERKPAASTTTAADLGHVPIEKRGGFLPMRAPIKPAEAS